MSDARESLGLYRVWWRGGGCSMAALGMRSDGSRWLAPTNWIDPSMEEAVWRPKVLRLERLLIGPERLAGWREHIAEAHALLDTVLRHEEDER